MRKFIQLEYLPQTGKTILNKVSDDHHLYDDTVPEENKHFFTSVLVQGNALDIEYILEKLFPDDDVTLISPKEPLPDVY